MKLKFAIAAALFVGGFSAAPDEAAANGHTNPFYTNTPFNDWCWASNEQSASRQPCPGEAWGADQGWGFGVCADPDNYYPVFLYHDDDGTIYGFYCAPNNP